MSPLKLWPMNFIAVTMKMIRNFDNNHCSNDYQSVSVLYDDVYTSTSPVWGCKWPTMQRSFTFLGVLVVILWILFLLFYFDCVYPLKLFWSAYADTPRQIQRGTPTRYRCQLHAGEVRLMWAELNQHPVCHALPYTHLFYRMLCWDDCGWLKLTPKLFPTPKARTHYTRHCKKCSYLHTYYNCFSSTTTISSIVLYIVGNCGSRNNFLEKSLQFCV